MTPPNRSSIKILFVDDDNTMLSYLTELLCLEGFSPPLTCQDPDLIFSILEANKVDLVFLDINMPGQRGDTLLPIILERFPETAVVMMSGLNQVEIAVKCMKIGACDYLLKPAGSDRILPVIRHVSEQLDILSENLRLKQSFLSSNLSHPEIFSSIHTQNPEMHAIFHYVEAIASTPLPVLITGESGTGKELMAKAIHTASGRKGEFVAINIAGADEQFFADQLFGHEKGAFTGAEKPRSGLIEKAAEGTLFLDEIGDIPMEIQVRLLRLLQEREYYKLGADKVSTSSACLITATHQDLEQRVKEGTFRKDLFYRLQHHHIHLPPLRKRLDDLPLLVPHLLNEAAQAIGKPAPTPPRELYTHLRTYHFPGNIRELQAIIMDAVSRHSKGILSLDAISAKIGTSTTSNDGKAIGSKQTQNGFLFPEKLPTLDEMESMLIDEALKRSENNQSVAAQLLGLSRRALNNRLARSS